MKEISTIYDLVFDEDNDTDQYLLNVLEEIYRATRYEDNFDIDVETLVLLEGKMKQLSENAISIYNSIISSFECGFTTDDKGADANSDKNCSLFDVVKSDVDGKIASLVEELKSLLPEDISVYLFGYRAQRFEMESMGENSSNGKYYFDFLIVSLNDIRELVNSVQATLNENLDVSVLLLSHQISPIQNQLDKNNPFFHKALQLKKPLFESLSISWIFHKFNGCRTEEELNKARSNWYQRENNASGFYSGGKAIDDCEEVEIKVLLYNQAIEQACLGLLEYFYDYTPYQYNLKHLFSLCASLWQFPNNIFPRNTEEEKSLFNEFAQTVKDTRYQGWSMVDWDEAYRYDKRCEQFLEQCSNLVRG